MANLCTSGKREDRLLSLPDDLLVTILSVLPTCIAARTSVLSRRFRDLWQQCPSVDLTHQCSKTNFFRAMADHALLRRRHPLLSLCLNCNHCTDTDILTQLVDKACHLGVRHLQIETWPHFNNLHTFSRLLYVILFNPALKSLSLPTLHDFVYPSTLPFARLTSLSLRISAFDPAKFHKFTSDLCSLVELEVTVSDMEKLSISSKTIRKLKLKPVYSFDCRFDSVVLCLPFLESLHLENLYEPHYWPSQFQGEIPLLRKAILTIHGLEKKICTGVPKLINYLSHVEELILNVREPEYERNPFPILLEEGEEAPNFPNLKHLEATMCFHEHNFKAIVSMIRHSPALQSVDLVHKNHETYPELWRRKEWVLRLPRNADGNYRYAHLTNLHLGKNRLLAITAMINQQIFI